MNTPFKNDPFAITWMAFKNLYPDKDCECWFDIDMKADDGDKAYGLTNFCDDGTAVVTVDSEVTLENATEILAHELAHVAVGYDHGHDDAWDEAFGKILEEYDRIGKEIVSKSNAGG